MTSHCNKRERESSFYLSIGLWPVTKGGGGGGG